MASVPRSIARPVELQIASRFAADTEKRIQDWLDRAGGGPSVYEIRNKVAEVMVTKVGVRRNEAELEQAVSELRQQLVAVDGASLRWKQRGVNRELSFALRLRGMTQLALITAMGALARTESRGAHCRTDYPQRDDASWLNRTLARWPEGARAPILSYEPVGLIDLPPADRGHDDTPQIPMGISIDAYNQLVEKQQREQGAPPSEGARGSRIRRRARECLMLLG